jgi:hypothetical protein
MKSDSRAKDLVASYSTAIISGLMSKVSALSLNHKLTQGELTELFITNVLSLFLTKQFDTGTGVIISSKQEESDQTDIIIYDNRILPPFIKESHIGVYPAESIVGVISVRSQLDGTVIKKTERSFKKLHEKIYNPASRLYGSDRCMEPICAIVGLYWKNNAKQNFLTRETGKRWLENNIKYSDAICLIENFSWLKINQWVKSRDEENFEETKRFIAVFLDSLRTRSENAYTI